MRSGDQKLVLLANCKLTEGWTLAEVTWLARTCDVFTVPAGGCLLVDRGQWVYFVMHGAVLSCHDQELAITTGGFISADHRTEIVVLEETTVFALPGKEMGQLTEMLLRAIHQKDVSVSADRRAVTGQRSFTSRGTGLRGLERRGQLD